MTIVLIAIAFMGLIAAATALLWVVLASIGLHTRPRMSASIATAPVALGCMIPLSTDSDLTGALIFAVVVALAISSLVAVAAESFWGRRAA